MHESNSQWWGEPVGIVDDADFFALPNTEQRRMLSAYAWVEFKSELSGAPPLAAISEAGFFLADTQIGFRIGLKGCGGGACTDQLSVQFADEAGFEYSREEMSPFEHERYMHLPECRREHLDSRYRDWACRLIREHPKTCLAVRSSDAVQGWFLSEPSAGSLNLTLAATHRQACISGLLLYQKSLAAYAAQGYRVGFASFSVRNTAVHNIYANLGARFTAPIGVWFWIRR